MGAKASLLLLKTQWGLSRSAKSRMLFALSIMSIAFVASIVSGAGEVMKYVALTDETAAQIYAKTFLTSVSRGELGAWGALALGVCLLTAIASPLTGATATSFTPPKELSGLSVPRWHRFTDSIVAQAISVISLLQIVSLLTLSSIFTIDGGRTFAMVFSLSIWLLLLAVATTSLWCADVIHRKFGQWTRTALGALVVAVVGVAIFLDPNNGRTVFGVGVLYSETIQGASTGSLPVAGQALRILAILILTAVFFYAGAVFCGISSSLPAADVKQSGKAVYRGRFALKSPSPYGMLVRSVLRLTEVRKPILSGAVVGITLMLFGSREFAVNSTFTVVIPLVVALAWGSNALAHLGGGATWLLSQPGALKRAPWVLFGLQLAFSVALFLTVWTPALVFGRATLEDFLTGGVALLASSVIIARSATTKAFLQPTTTHFGSRSDSTLSPSKALSYTLRFALWGGQYGILILLVDSLAEGLAMLGVAIVWQIARMVHLQEKWSNPKIRGRLAVAVAND